MYISPISIKTIPDYKNKNTTKTKQQNPVSPYSKRSFLAFCGSQKTPLTDEDYKKARKYFEETIAQSISKEKVSIRAFDVNKLNGLQKDIKVFDGLSMKDITTILRKPSFLLNRGCYNCCSHCGYSATPYSTETYDKMSYEDFKSLIDGIKELEKRMDNRVYLFSECGLFLDSDCMDIELKDKEGNIYDYTDCLKLMGDIDKIAPLLDTSGWNPKSQKHNARAQKFVDFVLSCRQDELDDINISINPYHCLCTKAAQHRKAGNDELANDLEEKYAKRMANVLFTFTPLIQKEYPVNILARVISPDETDTGCDENMLFRILQKIRNSLCEMYAEDLCGDRKYIKTQQQMNFLMFECNNLLLFTPQKGLFPWGRAQNLFNYEIQPVEKRVEEFEALSAELPQYMNMLINPNGKVVLSQLDISAKTDLAFNFENKNEKVKPFAHEIKGLTVELSDN